MPRAIFRLLWTFLEADRPIAAYVKNLAKDGSYYWVMALVVPVDGGYLSVRQKPCSILFAGVEALYRELRASEEEIESGGGSGTRERGIEAAQRRLQQWLREAGFAGYPEFMHATLSAEVTGRAAGLARRAPRRAVAVTAKGDQTLRSLLASPAAIQGFLGELVGDIERYGELNHTLVGTSRFVSTLAEGIRLSSLNALLAAGRLGDEGAALSAVASLLRDGADAAGPVIRDLGAEIAAVIDLLGGLGFAITAALLQTEMAGVFGRELLAADDPSLGAGQDLGADLAVLTRSLTCRVDGLLAALSAVEERLDALLRQGRRLDADLDVIRVLGVNGRIEATHAGRGGTATSIATLFRAIGEQVRVARAEMSDFAKIERLSGWRVTAATARVDEHLAHLRRYGAAPPRPGALTGS